MSNKQEATFIDPYTGEPVTIPTELEQSTTRAIVGFSPKDVQIINGKMCIPLAPADDNANTLEDKS